MAYFGRPTCIRSGEGFFYRAGQGKYEILARGLFRFVPVEVGHVIAGEKSKLYIHILM